MNQIVSIEIAAGLRIHLRAMQLEDLPQIVAIEAQSHLEPWTQHAFRAEMETSLVAQPFVALRQDEIVGYIVPWFVADELQIANITVKESFRQLGVGRLLLAHALELAQQRHCRVAYLEVRDSNAAARALYASMGFVVEGVRPKYYGRAQEDAILMKKDLLEA
ncbi:ribosomal protein S18-alanine N-acetyltransferase [candidate division KSB1 bacterium]|nr:ribosomal protein S18-alanine N-acetyltransferase [candidate division KSB1 bacterium]